MRAFVVVLALASGCAASLEASLRDVKSELDAGRRACAFARLEQYRRASLGDESSVRRFHEVFARVFLGPPLPPNPALEELKAVPEAHGPERRRALEAIVKAHPDDGEVLFFLAAEVQEANDLPLAEQLFTRAAELARANGAVQAWTGRFFLKAVSKPDRALDYYYRAYFLDPDYYETEFVEARIARALSQREVDACQ
jgi:tetratricopeptide (TPR) repeat protein